MSINLSGKYWNISELEKKFNVPSYKLYPILNSMQGVIKIGYAFLMPDYLMPVLSGKLENKKAYSLTTTSRLTNSSPAIIKLLITHGFPHLIYGIDEPRIEKKYIPALKKALSKTINIRDKTNKTGFALAVIKMVNRYMEEKGEKNV